MSGPSRPNLVLVSIDSLRADHCGYLGDDRELTPDLDALAEEGVAFENAIATGPQTFSSMPAVVTGRQRPPTLLADDDGETTHWERRLQSIAAHLDRYGTLAERLQDLGYATIGFTPNPWTATTAGFDAGFDHFEQLSDGEDSRVHDLVERLPGVDTDRKGVELALSLVTGSSFFAQWPSFYDDLRERVAATDEPYFLWVFLLDTHFPFITDRHHREEQSLVGMYTSNYRSEGALRGDRPTLPSAVRESVERSYRDTVRSVDDFLGTLRADLAADDPVTVVHSDHGESFGDHDNYGHHHRQVYEENVHVPLVVHDGGPSRDVTAPASLAGIHDGLLETARTGTFDPSAVTAETVFASSECGTHRTARGRRYKYVETDGQRLLFDLERDPSEETDRSAEVADRYRELGQELARFDGHVDETDRLGRVAATVAQRGVF